MPYNNEDRILFIRVGKLKLLAWSTTQLVVTLRVTGKFVLRSLATH